MLANNETGAIQPVREIVDLAGEYGAFVHTDAVQAAGKMQLSFPLLGVDALTISGHKLGGPQGTGALIVRDGLAIEPQITGGGQELRRRAGTENAAGMAGLGAAARAAGLAHKEFASGISRLRDDLEARLLEVAPPAVIFCKDVARLPNTTCFALEGLTADTFADGVRSRRDFCIVGCGLFVRQGRALACARRHGCRCPSCRMRHPGEPWLDDDGRRC